KLKDFVFTAFPLMVLGTFVLQFADLIGLLNLIENALSPITVWWLGLPLETGVTLIFGVLRKELTLIMLASIIGSSDLSLLLTTAQMFVFSFVVMVYVPCIATIAVLAREFGYRKAAIITLSEIGFAIVLGGIIMRVLTMLNI
ncbi:ferrous iron transport protein B, partial [Candidatus Bathyarchaeota archaeon]|nr:ferrous iron transport protein B [Candidatus Bathyarchaeota archaeon]